MESFELMPRLSPKEPPVWSENFFRRKQVEDKKVQGMEQAPPSERDQLKSFISFLHLVLIKIIRDKDKAVKVIVPRGNGSNLLLTIQEIPLGMKPTDQCFEMDYSILQKAVTRETFNTNLIDFDAVERGPRG